MNMRFLLRPTILLELLVEPDMFGTQMFFFNGDTLSKGLGPVMIG